MGHCVENVCACQSRIAFIKVLACKTVKLIVLISVIVVFSVIPQNGRTALMIAIARGHIAIVQLLLSSKAQVDLQDQVRHIN